MKRPRFLSAEALAAHAAVSLDAIELYTVAGLLSPFVLFEVKHYPEAAINRLEVIEKGRRLGFSLYEIKRLIEVHGSSDPFTEPRA